jgi:hypothetical protein
VRRVQVDAFPRSDTSTLRAGSSVQGGCTETQSLDGIWIVSLHHAPATPTAIAAPGGR